MKLFDEMLKLSNQGFFCAQILIILTLESEGEENPELVRAMGGLNNGLGYSGDICGALSGGCCLISYYAGKGEPDELEDPNTNDMIASLVEWFKEKYGERYGGYSCNAILEGNPANKMQRCPGITESVWEKARELLSENGIL